MKQIGLSDLEYSGRKRITKREEFLEIMEEIIPWDEWVNIIRPYYPDGKRGRPTKGIEKMLRMYLLQSWYNLSDEGIEDAIYDSYAFRKFMKIDFMQEQVPDATTLLKFRHLLEENHIGEAFFKAINDLMDKTGHIMHGGTIVDATIIDASSSTKNAKKQRDPEMHSAQKGNEWKYGGKCHIGVDAGSGLVHSMEFTAANVHDVTQAHKLIRESDEVVYGDAGYMGLGKRNEIKNNECFSNLEFRINNRPKSFCKISDNAFNWDKFIDGRKSATRCKVEHAFKYIKDVFHFRKTRYKGLAKNAHKLHVLFSCANLLMVKRAQPNFVPVMG